jgi:hypothetical protein
MAKSLMLSQASGTGAKHSVTKLHASQQSGNDAIIIACKKKVWYINEHKGIFVALLQP